MTDKSYIFLYFHDITNLTQYNKIFKYYQIFILLMLIHFVNDETIVNNPYITEEENTLVISSTKLNINHLDLNTFISQTFLRTINLSEHKKIVFNIFRLSENVLFAINQHRNIKNKTTFYLQSDNNVEFLRNDEICRTKTVCIILNNFDHVLKYMEENIAFNPIEKVAYKLVKEHPEKTNKIKINMEDYSVEMMSIYTNYFHNYKQFLFINNYKYNYVKNYVEEHPNEKIAFTCHIEEFFDVFPSVLNAKNLIEKEKYVCFAIDLITEINYNEFKQCVFFTVDKNILNKEFEISGMSIKKTAQKNKKICNFIANRKELMHKIDNYMIKMESHESIEMEEEFHSPYKVKNFMERWNRPISNIERGIVGKCVFPVSHAKFLLLQVLQSLKANLGLVELYIKNLVLLEEFRNTTASYGDALKPLGFYTCKARLNILCDFEVESNEFVKKKDCINHASLKFLSILHKSMIIDDQFSPQLAQIYAQKKKRKLEDEKVVYYEENHVLTSTVKNIDFLLKKAFKTTNLNKIKRMKEKFVVKNMEELKQKMIEENGALKYSEEIIKRKCSKDFERSHSIDFKEQTEWENKKSEQIGVPENFCSKTNKYAIYSFNNSAIGILCKKTFSGSFRVEKFEIECIAEELEITEDEGKLLENFQFVFFKNLSSPIKIEENPAFKLFYWAIPLKNRNIDFEYLKEIFMNFQLEPASDSTKLNDHLIWDLKNKRFVLYDSECEFLLENSMDEKNKQNQWIEKITKQLQNENKLLEEIKIGKELFYGFFVESLISKSHKTKTNDVTRIKPQLNPVIFLKEFCCVTPIKKTVIKDTINFVTNFLNFQTAACIMEFSHKYFSVQDKQMLLKALSPPNNGNSNYERLEFLGDCVLKFIVTNYLILEILERNTKMGKNSRFSNVVSHTVVTKDFYLSNEPLSKICVQSEVSKYVIYKMNRKYFQTPSLEEKTELEERKKYFGLSKNFSSNNLMHFLTVGRLQKGSAVNKTYADIIESLTGVLYLQKNLQAVIDFYYTISLLKRGETNKFTFIFPFENFFAVEFYDLITADEILQLEKIIGHTFKNKGLLEKVVIHASCSEEKYNSDVFNVLELIGDSLLDLMVVEMIYGDEQKCFTPLELHSYKKSFVNNFSLGNITKSLGIHKLSKRNTIKISNKGYGDIFESLIGAIYVDLDYNLDKFRVIYEERIKELIISHQSSVRYC
ncbi:hypothetical protein NUSPORA_02012 [Nucleospora cyclopteri]